MNPNRIRVLDFEKETEERLDKLKEVEADILSVGQMRSRWLLSVSNIDEVESETFRLKMEVLKAQTELAQVNLEVDKTKLEGHYETQTLNYLVQATKPLDNGESKERRNKSLEHMARENLDDLNAVLRYAVDYRAKIAKSTYDNIIDLAKLRVNNDNRHSAVVEELQERIEQYAERMKEAVITSKKSHQKITGEYLILRHNARVAKEVLLRSQNEAAMARKVLQEKLDRIVEEADVQRDKMETAALAELKIMTDDVRNAVIKRESEVNDIRRNIDQLESQRKLSNKNLKKAIAMYRKKYNALDTKRKSGVERSEIEIKDIRSKVTQLESNVSHENEIQEALASHYGAETFSIFQNIGDIDLQYKTGRV
mgnify:CR=1 FL=1